MRVVIIGGGTAGIFAGITLKKNCPSFQVTILERLEKIGKKILATGNGRCNYTNNHMDPKKYNNPSFVSPFIKQLDSKKLQSMFEELGLISTSEEARVYPYSELASSFLDVLRMNLKQLGVIEKCNCEVRKLTKRNDIYVIEDTRGQKYEAEVVILATGGKAYPILGSNGSGYPLLKPWKVKITDLEPGLVGIKVDPNLVKSLTGLRTKANVSLWDRKAKQKVWEESGEVQFKDDGVSGIVIMQMASRISRNAIARGNANYYFELDLLPELNEEQILTMLIKRKEKFKKFESSEFLTGLFPKMLGNTILKRARIDLGGYVENLVLRDMIHLANVIKAFSFEPKGTYNFDRAQVTIGGIDVGEVNKKTLELNKVPDIYVCGEVIDVDGECGGYNMHWALCSGYAVAKSVESKWSK